MRDGVGVTSAERYLSRLARRTFLRLWSHSNLFRDQGVKLRGEGAELCDLLVVFGSHLIIFSDKDCEFPLGDVDVAWRRWFKRAILGSAKQVFGAERWLREHPDRVFVDRSCSTRLPLQIPREPDVVFHRIVVAHDASGRRKAATGGSGSLKIDLRLSGDAHGRPASQGGHPFSVGHILRDRAYVHVLDDVALEIVMKALDTVTDFVRYLAAKEALIREGRVVGAFGEEDLLGNYLFNVDDDGKHSFDVPAAGENVVLDDSHWLGLQTRPGYLRKLEADRISYFWDEVIEEVSKHYIEGTLAVKSSVQDSSPERMLRMMASESRFRRRLLSASLREVILRASPPMRRMIRTHPSTKPDEPTYVFIASGPFPPPKGDHDMWHYRQHRRDVLESYCSCLAARLDEPGMVLGIATEGRDADGRSWDHVLLYSEDLTEADREEARRVAEEKGWFRNLLWTDRHEYEYPEKAPTFSEIPVLTSENRNKPCRCGSGKKFKKCHGRWG